MQRWEGSLDRGQAQESKVPKEGLSMAHCTRARRAVSCTGGLMKDTVRDKAGEGMLNWTMGTLKIGLFHSIL